MLHRSWCVLPSDDASTLGLLVTIPGMGVRQILGSRPSEQLAAYLVEANQHRTTHGVRAAVVGIAWHWGVALKSKQVMQAGATLCFFPCPDILGRRELGLGPETHLRKLVAGRVS